LHLRGRGREEKANLVLIKKTSRKGGEEEGREEKGERRPFYFYARENEQCFLAVLEK